MNIHEQLLKEGIRTNTQQEQQKVICPKCSHTRRNKAERCLSINIQRDVAVWQCHHCDWKGSVHENIREFKPKERYTNNVINIKAPQGMLNENNLNWIQSRNIFLEMVKVFNLYDCPRGIAFPYYLDGKVKNVKYRDINEKNFWQEKNTIKSLYNVDNLYKYWQDNKGLPKRIIFVEGEIDVITLYQCGFRNAVSLPDGAPKEAKYNDNDKRFSAFEQSQWIFDADEVIIATDNDSAGNALKLELIHRFGKDICKVVNFPKYKDATTEEEKQTKDANECFFLFGQEKVIECINNAQSFPIKGLHSASEYKQTLQDMYDGNVQKAESTGLHQLDKIYKIMTSTFNLVTGIPNHGKSNFLDQILMNMAENQSWKFAVYSPEHSTANHIRRLLEKRCRKPFDIGAYERISDEEKNAGIDFIDNHFKFIENTDEIPTIDYILSKSKIAKLRYGIKGLIIDPFNQISQDRDNNKREDEHIRDIIAKCQQFARNHQIWVCMVAHPHKLHRNDSGVIPPPDLYQVSGSAHWANMADAGLVIHRDFEENTTKVITRKIREQGVYGEIGQAEFIFNYRTRCYE
tara:strand:+ start:219 stop:1940 length:1722 start_codon:yes stop_codon:yes gene_type:complete